MIRQDQVSTANGNKAMFLARLTARVSCLWCLAQFPEIREGMIFPLSEIKGFKFLISSKSMWSAFSPQNRQIFCEKKDRFRVLEVPIIYSLLFVN
jgi:hypothetical protein